MVESFVLYVFMFICWHFFLGDGALQGLSDGPDADHEACNAELERLRQQLEWYQRQREERTPSLANDREAELSRLRVQVCKKITQFIYRKFGE